MRLHTTYRVFTVVTFFLIGLTLVGCNLSAKVPQREALALQSDTTATSTATATLDIPPSTPLATLTPSRTLLPPPTFEPPTATLAPSNTPTITPTTALDLSVSVPGLRGLETATPSTTPGCEPREDWTLIYTVQRDDALARIAEHYGTYVSDLVAGNCLTNPDLITIGQQIRVPGGDHPYVPSVECVPFELLTPANGTLAIEGGGTLTFNWRGPRAPRNLIRIHEPDGDIVEYVIELRQNETVTLDEDLREAGTYTWYIYPLDENFRQIDCPEGGPWTFTKAEAPTYTPEPETQEPVNNNLPVVTTEAPTEDPETTDEPAA